MSKAPSFQPLANLAVRHTTLSSVHLQGRHALVELRAVAADLFRLRITSKRKFSNLPSWAVEQGDWPTVSTKVRVGSRSV